MFKRSIRAILALFVLGLATPLSATTLDRSFSTADFTPNSSSAIARIDPGIVTPFSTSATAGTGELSLGFQAEGVNPTSHGRLKAVLVRYEYDIPIQLLTEIRGSDGGIFADFQIRIETFLDTKDVNGQTRSQRLGNEFVHDRSLSCISSGPTGCVDNFTTRLNGVTHASFINDETVDFTREHNLRTTLSVDILGFDAAAPDYAISGSLFGPESRFFSGDVNARFTYITAPPVPLPASVVTSLTGLLAFLVLGWRRRRGLGQG